MEITDHSTNFIIKSGFITTAGWTVSLSDVETGVRLISLIVPTVLSILLYIKKTRRNKSHDEENS